MLILGCLELLNIKTIDMLLVVLSRNDKDAAIKRNVRKLLSALLPSGKNVIEIEIFSVWYVLEDFQVKASNKIISIQLQFQVSA